MAGGREVMTDPKYDIYFRGEVLPGFDGEQVKQSIATLFKASDSKLEQLFSGKVNVIKKSVDKATAAKYQQAFKKAGAKAVITLAKDEQLKNETQSLKAEPKKDKKDEVQSEQGNSWDVLPVGSDLLKPDERRQVEDPDIDVSAIKMVSPFEEIEVEQKPVTPAPKTDHITVAEVGEDMNPDRPASPPAPELDLSELSVAEPGADLGDKKEKEIPPAPDTTHIQLV